MLFRLLKCIKKSISSAGRRINSERIFRFSFEKNMSAFTSVLNPITGKKEWILQNEDYDYHKEIARSAYADMLHDTERNKKYDIALKKAIDLKHKAGEPANVLDIGTGSGLLSLMAVRSGADNVFACEAFLPMADCASEIINTNRASDKIRLIKKRSTEIIVGEDMPFRANILVTEVFDTELIGEGAISTFSHALELLLEKDSIVVPAAANMYAQVVQSDTLTSWNRFKPVVLHKSPAAGSHTTIKPPEAIASCHGVSAVHDIQLSQLEENVDFIPLSKPVTVFRFNFGDMSTLAKTSSSLTDVPAERDGRADAVFMWWDLQMDVDGDVMLSCAPRWTHPTPHHMQWRDHWLSCLN